MFYAHREKRPKANSNCRKSSMFVLWGLETNSGHGISVSIILIIIILIIIII